MLLSRLVSTQREQIAVIKAFGYNNLSIGFHYLKFVLLIVFCGAFLGTVLGLWFGVSLTSYYTNFFNFPVLRYKASLGLVLGAILISGGSGVFGAFNAVKQAVSLPPAEAMRPEPPVRFKATVVEKLGLQKLLSPGTSTLASQNCRVGISKGSRGSRGSRGRKLFFSYN